MTSAHFSKVLPLLAAWFCLGAAGTAQAQAVADPTRPPDAWLAAQPAAPQTDAAPAQSADSGAHVTVTGKNRRYAVIDGQVVKPGDQINGARVVAIKANSVTLKQNDSRQVLSLTPGVEKKTPKPVRQPKAKTPAK